MTSVAPRPREPPSGWPPCRWSRWCRARSSAAGRPRAPFWPGRQARRILHRPRHHRVRLRRVAGSHAERTGEGPPVVGRAARSRRRPRFPGGESLAGHAGAGGRGHPPSRCARSRHEHGRRRGLGRREPRRHHQVDPRRRARHAPRPVPADRGRSGIRLDHPLQRDRPDVLATNTDSGDLGWLGRSPVETD